MTNPYSDNIKKIPKNKKKGSTLSDRIITISLIFCTLFLIFGIGPDLLFMISERITPKKSLCICCIIEEDANKTLYALSSYFSVPEHDEVPTFEELVETEDLKIHKNSTVTIDGTADTLVRITVINNTKKCPLGKKYEKYMTGSRGTWYPE